MTKNEVWRELYTNQWEDATKHAVSEWNHGFFKMDLLSLPLLEDIYIPHWKVRPIIGKSEEDIFWYRISRGMFNVNERLRPYEQLDYLEERDLFHDVFGHLPILHSRDYSNYLLGLGALSQSMVDSKRAKRALSNIYWFTSEFGLMKNEYDNEIKVYGAGVLSSHAELEYALGPDANRINFPNDTYDKIELLEYFCDMDGYITDGFQEVYLVLNGMYDLKFILSYMWKMYT